VSIIALMNIIAVLKIIQARGEMHTCVNERRPLAAAAHYVHATHTQVKHGGVKLPLA
jgi:hypothetical protein